jgi:hypothetical protein
MIKEFDGDTDSDIEIDDDERMVKFKPYMVEEDYND